MDEFILTEQHIKLIQNMYISWWDAEYGAPGVDPKRPYGNSYVDGDLAEILGVVGTEHDADYDEPQLSEDQLADLARIHRETETALQIIVSTKSFVPGLYRSDKYLSNWELVQ
jgi:hypothetical protein